MVPNSSFAVVVKSSNDIVLADPFTFRVGVGRGLSPMLHLVQVIDYKPELNAVQWQWWRPHNRAITVHKSQRMSKETVVQPGFKCDDLVRNRSWSYFEPSRRCSGRWKWVR